MLAIATQKSFRNLLVLLAAGLTSVGAFEVTRRVCFPVTDMAVQAAPALTVAKGAAGRLGGAIRIPTISNEDPAAFDSESFRTFHTYLEGSFPGVHQRLRRETVALHSLLYTWEGTDRSLKPVLLMGHLDVVPVEPGTEGDWQEHPFSGQVKDGFIWGRGAIDNKSAVGGGS